MSLTRVFQCMSGLIWAGLLARSALAAPASTAPCALLTQAQVSAALGVSVAAGQAIGSTACDWEGPAGSKMRVTLALWPATGWAKMKAPLPNVAKNPVSGLGDDAFVASMGTFAPLSVKKGDSAFILRVYGIADMAKQQTIEQALAVNVVAGL
ncbi:MAG TPA: hypothetical protein VK695_02220 [Steroidobacteraceae bacterium]|jgi:hypothetical protein|nr:hypothetical protein [Steroidobacteraceae bacterium]